MVCVKPMNIRKIAENLKYAYVPKYIIIMQHINFSKNDLKTTFLGISDEFGNF